MDELRFWLDTVFAEDHEAADAWVRTRLLELRGKTPLVLVKRGELDRVIEMLATQRGVVQLPRLLREWRELDPSDDPMTPAAWHALLRKLLEANELVLSTPGQKGRPGARGEHTLRRAVPERTAGVGCVRCQRRGGILSSIPRTLMSSSTFGQWSPLARQ